MLALDINNVSKSFNGHQALKSFSLQVPPGSMCGLLGPNGAGKTTTIRMIMNIIAPDSGSIEIFGYPVQDRDKVRIGYLPEERGLYPKMRVGELLLFFAQLKGVGKEAARRKISEWLERMGLSDWRDKKVEALSKGMQQKVQFIATLLHDPELVILDEPFAGLDPINTNLLKEIILALRASGKTILLSTHRMEQVEKLCDTICLINKGEKVLDGNLLEIKQRYGKNCLFLEYQGDLSFLRSSPMVATVDDYGNYAEIRLRPGADAQQLLKLAIERVRIKRFELAEPSLNQIFIEKVTGELSPPARALSAGA